MRTIFPLMIAVALSAAAPAAAQNTDAATDPVVTAPAGDDAVMSDNAMVADPAMSADPANDLSAVPMTTEEPLEMTMDEPAPAKKNGFPWGVLGLLGLLGLIPRKARS